MVTFNTIKICCVRHNSIIICAIEESKVQAEKVKINLILKNQNQTQNKVMYYAGKKFEASYSISLSEF